MIVLLYNSCCRLVGFNMELDLIAKTDSEVAELIEAELKRQ